MAKKILIGLLLLLVVIQFFNPEITAPATDPALDFISIESPPEGVAKAVQNSCYDCHSNQTVYPWYAKVAPVSWMISSHVKEARGHLNFSKWADYPQGRIVYILKDCYQEIDDGEMPLPSYRMMHKEARMDMDTRQEVLQWMSTRGNWEE